MAMSAVGACDVVVVAQGGADANLRPLLSDRQVGEAGHYRRLVQLVDPLFEVADRRHTSVDREPKLGVPGGWDRYCVARCHRHPLTLFTSTSAATSRLMPAFSAISTPSLNASIWVARLRFVAIFIVTARPLAPT